MCRDSEDTTSNVRRDKGCSKGNQQGGTSKRETSEGGWAVKETSKGPVNGTSKGRTIIFSVSSNVHRDSEDMPKTSPNVRQDSVDVSQKLCHLCRGAEVS